MAGKFKRYENLIDRITGRAYRNDMQGSEEFREDGYKNVLTKYGTQKDSSEHYTYVPETTVGDDTLVAFYESNGLFSKIIDAPAEEAIKHGFELDGVKDDVLKKFYKKELNKLDWEENFITCIKWARLFGGCIAVMLINDGRGIDEPVDWDNIKSIDDIRIYDRSVVIADESGIFNYTTDDPFKCRGTRFGMPEYYDVSSRYGSFRVHESRCLIFQNGILPENTTSSIYRLWGIPEYVRLNRAIRDAEVAHGSAVKLLDRSVQAVYKMKDLAAELATEGGEERVLRRLQTIDMARGLLNSVTIDSEGEDYDFRQFSYSGVSDVINTTCNYLSALTCIPQTILFGRSPAGMNATGESDLENWYNYVERIQKRMVASNLRYLLSIIFRAGCSKGKLDKVPEIDIEFNALWSLSDLERADLEGRIASAQQTRAQTAQIYIDMQAISSKEVRKALAKEEDFDVESMLDELSEKELADGDKQIEEQAKQAQGEQGGNPFGGQQPEAPKKPVAKQKKSDTNADTDNPNQSEPDKEDAEEVFLSYTANETPILTPKNNHSVGVIVVQGGKILCAERNEGFGYGKICGAGGHIEAGEYPQQAAFRELKEEFGIDAMDMDYIGDGKYERQTGLTPHLFLCTTFAGVPKCVDGEMSNPDFLEMDYILNNRNKMFAPFYNSVVIFKKFLEERVGEPNQDIPEREQAELIMTTKDDILSDEQK